jgi:hypothetical protein
VARARLNAEANGSQHEGQFPQTNKNLISLNSKVLVNLTPRNKVIPEKIIIAQLVNNFLALYESLKLNYGNLHPFAIGPVYEPGESSQQPLLQY